MPQVISAIDIVSFTTSPETLAEYLYTYARDWAEVLVFFENYCKSVGIPLDSRKVSEIVIRLIGE